MSRPRAGTSLYVAPGRPICPRALQPTGELGPAASSQRDTRMAIPRHSPSDPRPDPVTAELVATLARLYERDAMAIPETLNEIVIA